ncbi:FadR family transcriptional regulator [Candidatus Bipolaricaulota bacterium]|nr:FadR family transcriptional regulator [Candidatus Bipolaricaulota bacterium]
MDAPTVLSGERKRSLRVLDWVIDSIRSGKHGEGSRLPTERELADWCGVSRASVREALSILSALDIVDRRVGDGTYVKSCDEQLLSLTLDLIRGESPLEDVFEVQRILEVGMAEIAARAMSPAQIGEVEAALVEMEEAARTGDTDRYFAADRRFHHAVSRATGNRLLERQVQSLIDQMDRPLWRRVKGYFIRSQAEYVSRSLADHRRLVAAFRNRDTAAARRIMEDHFERVREEIFGER